MSSEESSTIVASLRARPPEEAAAILIACALHMLRNLPTGRRPALWVLRRAFRLISGQGKQVDPWTWAQERIRPQAPTEPTEGAPQPQAPVTPDTTDEPPPQGEQT